MFNLRDLLTPEQLAAMLRIKEELEKREAHAPRAERGSAIDAPTQGATS